MKKTAGLQKMLTYTFGIFIFKLGKRGGENERERESGMERKIKGEERERKRVG